MCQLPPFLRARHGRAARMRSARNRRAENILLFCFLVAVAEEEENVQRGSKWGKRNRRRTRRSIRSIFDELGGYGRRVFCMPLEAFLELHEILKDDLDQYFHPLDGSRGAPGGVISSALRLCAAIRYFSGGSTYDIMLMLGMSHSSVYESIWGVVDCVNQCSALSFSFPSPEEQKDIAEGFQERSSAGFDVVVGAVDGMLVWTKKPSRKECRAMECGESQFFCDRKKKFGLNLQAIVDHLGRFTWISLEYPGACSDYLAWSCSDIVSFLEQDGVLLPGHTIVGDNAYVKKMYMATPILGASAGLEDAYNFYHSQVRIIVECAFGMLVHRWGILRGPLNCPIYKVGPLVMCLCRLHNFCINQRVEVSPGSYERDEIRVRSRAAMCRQECNEPVCLDSCGRPRSLLSGGHHWKDVGERAPASEQARCPMDYLVDVVREKDLRRPTFGGKPV